MTCAIARPDNGAWQDNLISASEISAYRDCPRKWGWNYVDGVSSPSHPSAVLGTEVDDKQIQPYLRDGRSFDYSRPSGDIAASMLPYLPQPGTVEIQKRVLMPSPTWVAPGKHVGFGFSGYADIWAEDSILFPGLPGGAPGVGDTKTTSDIRKWAKTPKTLAVDVQAMIYATFALYLTGAPCVDLAWIYGQTKGSRKGSLVYLRVNKAHVGEQFEGINETAREICGLRERMIADPVSRVLDLPFETNACESYGGCPYQSLCNLSPIQIMESHAAKATARQQAQKEKIEMGTLDALAGLKARAAAAAAAKNGNIATAPPVVVTQPGKIEAASVTSATPPPVAAPRATGINPPESLLPPAPAVGVTQMKARPTVQVQVPEETQRVTVDVVQSFRVVWAEEAISPIQYNSFRVGPFEACGIVQPGETLPVAMTRVYCELKAFAEGARRNKAESFGLLLQEIGK